MLVAFALWVTIVVLMLGGCTSEPVKPIIEKETTTVPVPTPVPCFEADVIPVLPEPTKVDTAHATTDQLAAAAAADAEAYQKYAKAVDKMWAKCLKSGGGK